MRVLASVFSAIAATAILAGCAGGLNSVTLPAGGADPATSLAGSLRVIVAPHGGAYIDSGSGCIPVSASQPVSGTYCISSSGNCSSGLVGTWTWTQVTTNIKTGKIIGGKHPNPDAYWTPVTGNPSTLTVTSKNTTLKKKCKPKFDVTLSTCSSSSYCFSDFATLPIGF